LLSCAGPEFSDSETEPEIIYPDRPDVRPLQIAAGSDHTCAWTVGGSVHCWGFGISGALGYGNRDAIGDDEPARVGGPVDVGGSVVSMAMGDRYTCATLEDGELLCWGVGQALGQPLGRRSHTEPPSHFDPIELGAKVAQIAAGGTHACATTEHGTVRCWGDGDAGALGYGSREDVIEAGSVGDVDVGDEVLQVAAGGAHTCALLASNQLRCWGGRSFVSCNPEAIGDDEPASMAALLDVGPDVVKIDAGMFHTCALLASGEVRCWGENYDGQLGYPLLDSLSDPTSLAAIEPVNVGGKVVDIALGSSHTCALLEDGAVKCWGSGNSGTLGYGSPKDVRDPSEVGEIELGGRATAIAAGSSHTCAVLEGKRVRCWGSGSRLGYGVPMHIGDDEVPASVSDVPLF
jgi:alpha-tubulin suppressor-like RCC1 family protein